MIRTACHLLELTYSACIFIAYVLLLLIVVPFHCGNLKGQSESSLHNEVDVLENNLDTQAEDQELKIQLLRKYSGYLGGLKKEFLKKKKNGKLPKEARLQLLDWWNRHYKWPYPSVTN